MANEVFNKYYKRLVKEGIIKATLSAFGIGFVFMLISAVIFFFTNLTNLFWISIIIFAAVTIILMPIFYFKRFKPDTKMIAKRVDELGLEERLITMAELEGDMSYIAMKQREDTAQAVASVEAKAVKFSISKLMLVLVSVFCVLAVGMTVYTSLVSAGVAPGIDNIIDIVFAETAYYEVSYEIEDGEGYFEYTIDDETQQSEVVALAIEAGEDAPVIVAVATDGWYFSSWSDGVETPERQDLEISEDLEIYAIFEEAEEQDGDGDGDGDSDGDEADSSEEGEQGDSSDSGDGESDSSGTEGESDASDSTSNGAGGQYSESNQYLNGETYYGSDYDAAVDDASDSVNSDDDLSDGQRGAIEDYFSSIED